MMNTLATERRNCEQHGDYRASRIILGGHTMWSACPVCAVDTLSEAREHDLTLARRERRAYLQRRHLERVADSGVPLRYQSATFAGYQTQNEHQDAIKRVLQSYADKFHDLAPRGTSLILAGHSGTGKTHLACAIGNQLIAQGYGFAFMTTHQAIAQVKRTWGRREMDEVEVVRRFCEPDLLVLDEVEKITDSPSDRVILFEVLNARYEALRPTILISNLSGEDADPEGVRAFLGSAIFDRTREGGGRVLKFDWGSHRGSVA